MLSSCLRVAFEPDADNPAESDWLFLEPQLPVKVRDFIRMKVYVLSLQPVQDRRDHLTPDPTSTMFGPRPHVDDVRIAYPVREDAGSADNAPVHVRDDTGVAVPERFAQLLRCATVVEAISRKCRFQLVPVDVCEIGRVFDIGQRADSLVHPMGGMADAAEG